MRKILFLVICTFCLSFICIMAHAHPGRTDSNGGHTDHSTGEYHYHHGYPAHDHYDIDGDGIIDCPYDFIDKNNQSSGNISESSTSARRSYETSTASLSPGSAPAQSTQRKDMKQVPPWVYWIFGILSLSVICLFVSNKRKKDEIKQLKIIQNQDKTNYRKEIDKKEQELKDANTFLDFSQENSRLLCERIESLCTQNALLQEENASLSQQAHKEQPIMVATNGDPFSAQRIYGSEVETLTDENEALKKDNQGLRATISELNQKIKSLNSALSSSEERKRQFNRITSMQNISQSKRPPEGISYASDGLPVFWKPNPKKPYGDFTVYLNEKSGIYHVDYLCASYMSKETHIFKVIENARPCKKCAEGFFNFTTIPDWYKS